MADMEINFCDPVMFNVLLQLRRDRKTSWRAVCLGMVIANFANQDGDAWPSRTILSAITGIDKADISTTARELRDAGFLTIDERAGHSTVYRLTRRRFTTGGDLPPVGVSPPTRRQNTPKPVGVSPPITIKEQLKNNEYAQNDEKPPSSSAPTQDKKSTPTTAKSKTETKPQKPKVILEADRFIIPKPLLQTWGRAYPEIDIDREAAKAFAWCMANPSKAPKKDYTRFLNSWLGRAKPSRQADPANDDYVLRGDSYIAALEFAGLSRIDAEAQARREGLL